MTLSSQGSRRVQQPRSSRIPLLIAIVVGVGLILALRSFMTRGGDTARGGKGAGAVSGDCVELSVVGSSEKAALLSEMAAAYERSGPRVAGRCVRVKVASKASGGAAEALARGWDESADGPRPDVWTPAASSWVVILRQRLAQRDAPNLVPADIPHIANSPLVIAMPRPMAEALGWPNKPVGWGDVLALARDPAGWGKFGHPEWGPFRLGKTNPNFSTSGLHATVGAYFAATGRSSDLTETDIVDAKVRDFVKGVESSVVHYGDITLTFLENLQRADDRGLGLTYISAVTIEEKSVWDYNRGNPTGDPKTLGKHKPPRTPLAAIYPREGTLYSDHPWVVLTGSWVDEPKRRAAADFRAFLQRPQQQSRFQQAAFRDFEGKPGDEIKASNGMLPAEPKAVLNPPAPPVLDKIQLSWRDLRKRARVLMVIDVSGSMGQSVPGSGASKLDLAKQAAIKAMDQFAPDDEIGLWVFASDLGQNAPYLESVPLAPAVNNIGQIVQTIRGLTPRSGTALYATIRGATKQMREGFDPNRINGLILLTDGRNEYPPDTDLDGLLRSLRTEGEEAGVRVFPIAYGEDADLNTLRRIADASRATVYDSSDPTSIDKAFTNVVSNF